MENEKAINPAAFEQITETARQLLIGYGHEIYSKEMSSVIDLCVDMAVKLNRAVLRSMHDEVRQSEETENARRF